MLNVASTTASDVIAGITSTATNLKSAPATIVVHSAAVMAGAALVFASTTHHEDHRVPFFV
jgi:hypothetical protein